MSKTHMCMQLEIVPSRTYVHVMYILHTWIFPTYQSALSGLTWVTSHHLVLYLVALMNDGSLANRPILPCNDSRHPPADFNASSIKVTLIHVPGSLDVRNFTICILTRKAISIADVTLHRKVDFDETSCPHGSKDTDICWCTSQYILRRSS
jgi:hypothetical protein